MKERWIAAFGGIVVILGSALPWVTAEVALIGRQSVGGLEADGIITLLLGIVVLILALGAPEGSDKTAAIVAGLLALVAAAIGFNDLHDINRVFSGTSTDFLLGSVSIGIGLYLVVIGASVAVVGSLLWYVEVIPEQLPDTARTLRIAVIAILTAVTIVFTLAVRIPFAPTRGYFTLADVAVYFTGFAFGPFMGFIVGGLGTGLADILGGFAHFAIWSFLIHGLQGWVAGFLGYRKALPGMVTGWIAGGAVMVGGYFIVEYFLYGPGPALSEAGTINVPQVLIGGLAGLLLVPAVRRAYPQIDLLVRPRAWREE